MTFLGKCFANRQITYLIFSCGDQLREDCPDWGSLGGMHGATRCFYVPCMDKSQILFASPLGFYIHTMPNDFKQATTFAQGILPVSAFKLFLDTLWASWKVRYSFLYEVKKASPVKVHMLVNEFYATGLTLSIFKVTSEEFQAAGTGSKTSLQCP
jgi:hypothetical protein